MGWNTKTFFLFKNVFDKLSMYIWTNFSLQSQSKHGRLCQYCQYRFSDAREETRQCQYSIMMIHNDTGIVLPTMFDLRVIPYDAR
jgi:hypothetical protein